MGTEHKKKRGEIDIEKSSLAFGLGVGTMFGIVFDNLTLWLPLGLCLALALSAVRKKKGKNNNNNTNEPDKE